MRRRSALWIVVCSIALGGHAAWAQAQAESPRAPAAPRCGVALIDLGTIVDRSNHFQQMAASWKHDIKAAEERMETEGERGNQLIELMKNYAGSQDYKSMESAAYKERAEFQRHWSRIYVDFELRKAKMYYAIRAEVKDDARHYAQQHGLSLVLHYDSTPVNPKDPKSILRALNKAVFYQQGCDITPVVLREMNRRVPLAPVPAQTANGGGAASSTAPPTRAATLPPRNPANGNTPRPR